MFISLTYTQMELRNCMICDLLLCTMRPSRMKFPLPYAYTHVRTNSSDYSVPQCSPVNQGYPGQTISRRVATVAQYYKTMYTHNRGIYNDA